MKEGVARTLIQCETTPIPQPRIGQIGQKYAAPVSAQMTTSSAITAT